MSSTKPGDIVIFISHATQDNERFVKPFNEHLLSYGFGTIVDFQDFGLGESLVFNIFDRGIYDANAIVVVISQHTGGRNWPRAELDHAVVRNIEESIPVIAVVLDGADVPPPLRAALQLRLSETDTPELAAKNVAEQLLGRSPGKPPAAASKAQWLLAPLSGLSDAAPIDEYVLRYVVEQFVSRNYEHVDVSELLLELEKSGGGNFEELETSLYILEQHGMIRQHYEIGSRLPYDIELTVDGALSLLDRFMPKLLSETQQAVIRKVKEAYPAGVEISHLASDINSPEVVVLYVAKSLEKRGLMRVETYIGGWGDVFGTPMITRF